ncbi:hypothetical protein KKB83_01575 [Patescibacteria group bacterium]|nr:hypothetical protein [Patescibacteria group bacterium]
MKTKKTIIAIAAISVLTVGGLWATTAKAQTDNLGLSLTDRVADQFGLNADEVQGVMDNFRQERFQKRQELMREKMEENLGEAVADGVITEDQRQTLMEKKQEMRERHQQLREEWQGWAEESGIDFDALREYGVRGMDMGFKSREKIRGGGCMR